MNTKLHEGVKTSLALLALPVLLAVWAVKRLVFIVFVLGLIFPLVPNRLVQEFLSLPGVGHLSPVFAWLVEHGLRLCLVLSFLMIMALMRKLSRLQMHQTKQAFVLGGLLHYLEISEYRFAEAIEEMRKPGLSFEDGFSLVWKTWFATRFAKWTSGEDASEFIAGTDPFDTAFKRGDKIATLRDDVKSYVQELRRRDWA